jgi:Effector-associated domain 11
MSLTDKIKNLIADGKTLQAVDMLQAFLKANSGGDNQLLNQTLLLEGQYKEVQKKMQLGLEDAGTELNRINFSLLNLCDEAEKLNKKADENEEITEGSKNAPLNPLVVFGVIAAVAILTIVGLLFLNKGDGKANIREATETAPLGLPKAAASKNWHALESVLNVNDRLYGHEKITISSIKTESFDGERDRLILNLDNNCTEASSGSCMANYLKFRLTIATNKVLEPESDKAFDVQASQTTRDETVRFIVPKSASLGILDVFYVDKPASKATTRLSKD